jgi:hypothetical protein
MSSTTNDITATAHEGGFTIRCLGGADAAAIRRLAERDTARLPAGPLLGAEVDGHLRAAISTKTGELIADPFHPTTRIVEVLRLRANQLDGRRRGRGLLAWLLARPAAGAAHAPSPPGAGGRLLTHSRPAR